MQLADVIHGIMNSVFGEVSCKPSIYQHVLTFLYPSSDLKDSADYIGFTTKSMPLHTDLTYYCQPPGLQFFHCLRYTYIKQELVHN